MIRVGSGDIHIKESYDVMSKVSFPPNQVTACDTHTVGEWLEILHLGHEAVPFPERPHILPTS